MTERLCFVPRVSLEDGIAELVEQIRPMAAAEARRTALQYRSRAGACFFN